MNMFIGKLLGIYNNYLKNVSLTKIKLGIFCNIVMDIWRMLGGVEMKQFDSYRNSQDCVFSKKRTTLKPSCRD